MRIEFHEPGRDMPRENPDKYPFPPYVMLECRRKDDNMEIWIGLVDKRNNCVLDYRTKPHCQVKKALNNKRFVDILRTFLENYKSMLKKSGVY